MSQHVERAFRIFQIISTSKKGITVSEITKLLESNHKIFVSERSVLRTVTLLSNLFYNEIDYIKHSDESAFRWFRKEVSKPLINLSSTKTLEITHKSDFRKNCDDIAWYIGEDLVFDAIRKNSFDFSANNLFDDFYVLNNGISIANTTKMVAFVKDRKSAEDLADKFKAISEEISNIKSILCYIDIDKSQWDTISSDFENIKSTAESNNIELVVRYRNKNENDKEVFNDFLQAYSQYENELTTKIIHKLPRKELIEAKDNLLDLVEILENLGEFNVFLSYSEILLTEFYNEWESFLLRMANKYLYNVKISNDSIGFDCEPSSNCKRFYSIKHDSICVFGEIHDELRLYFEKY